jgi:large conductance mechanosensitive channel
MLKEFKEFINRGNVIDLAVAVIIGTAFAAVIKAFTDDILGGILALIGGKPDFGEMYITVSGTRIIYGTFLTSFLNFLIVAFVMFLVVKGFNALKTKQEEDAPPTEAELLTEIRDLLKQRA